ADDLSVLENEGYFARAHFQHRARAAPRAGIMPETGIEEARVMDAEFADHGIERHHLGGEFRRNGNRLARGENVELVRIEHDPLDALARRDRIPEIERIAGVAQVDV